MSKLDDLIKKFCPNGVKFLKFEEYIDYEQPTRYIVHKEDYNNNYDTPVLTAGQTFILGYSSEKDNIYPASTKNPVIIFDDFTGAFKWVDFPFKVKSSAMKILSPREGIILRYVFHIMGHINFSSSEHKRLWISFYSQLSFPVPPLPVQEEIVRILDSFTKLEAELEAELEARRRQYEYYRDKLLNFNDLDKTKMGG